MSHKTGVTEFPHYIHPYSMLSKLSVICMSRWMLYLLLLC